MLRLIYIPFLFGMLLTLAFDAHAQFISDLKISEIMYNPPDELPVLGSDLEFIELKNTGTGTLDLSNVSFVSGITFTFPFAASIGPGAHLVLVSDQTEFANKYPGVTFYGQYLGLLANTGERIKVTFGTDTIINIRYNDNLPWPVLADGNGYSVVPVDANPTGLQELGGEWRSSANPGGSPGMDDPIPPNIPGILVNEVLSAPLSPEVDAVELHNPTGSAVDISGWFLSDDRNNLKKFKIPPATSLPADGYIFYDSSMINMGPNGFRFSQSGDNVYLTSADASEDFTGYLQGWSFNAQFPPYSFGIHESSEGKLHFTAQEDRTFGAVNSAPHIFPILFTKIMYNPEPGEEEFVEIKNTSINPVNLWSTDFPDTTWRVSGMGFTFPMGVTIQPDETIVLCDIDPNDFRAKFDLPASQQVFQFFGSLANEGERIRIRATGLTDTTGNDIPFVPYVDMDVVEFDDKVPWPVDADGDGAYLLRNSAIAFGNDPANWTAVFGDPFVGIEERNLSNLIQIYPNPATSFLFIDFDNSSVNSNISISNTQGQMIYEAVATQGRMKVDLSDFQRGLLIVELLNQDQVFTKKILIY